MRWFGRVTMVAAAVLGLAVNGGAQEKSSPPSAATEKALVNAMTPGEGQERLEFMIGTFDVSVRIWLDPSKPPVESTATSVATWVLGKRYVQQMMAGTVEGEPWAGIVYAGYDNVTKKYMATYMDSGSTGMEWYTGTMDASGKIAKMTGTTHDEITGKPEPVELRLTIAPNGDHVTQVWQGDDKGKMSKVMELQYSHKKS